MQRFHYFVNFSFNENSDFKSEDTCIYISDCILFYSVHFISLLKDLSSFYPKRNIISINSISLLQKTDYDAGTFPDKSYQDSESEFKVDVIYKDSKVYPILEIPAKEALEFLITSLSDIKTEIITKVNFADFIKEANSDKNLSVENLEEVEMFSKILHQGIEHGIDVSLTALKTFLQNLESNNLKVG